MALVVPSRSANATFALRHVSVSEESDHREEPQQRRGGPLDRPFRPMPLGFEPEALAGLLECGLHLPAFHEPRDHPLRIGIEVGAQQSLGFEVLLWVADQYPAHGNGGQARGVPERRFRDDLNRALCTAIPVAHVDGPPGRLWVFDYPREGRKALALKAGSSHLVRLAWWGRLVEGGVQPKASDEGDGVPQMPAAIQELQGSISTVGDGYDPAFWVPASYQQEHLPGPLGEALVAFVLLLGVELGVRLCREES